MVPINTADAQTFDQEVIKVRGALVIVYFWGPDCPNCEEFAAELPDLLFQLADLPIRLVKINAYAEEELARRFAIHGIPSFRLFRDGIFLGKMSEYQGREYWLRVVQDHIPPS